MPRPSLARLAAVYGKIAAFTFGGGDPTMAALQTELVRNRRWLTPETYSLAYGLGRLTPGTNMLAFIAGSAWSLLGWRGAVAAVLATTVPGALLVVLLSAGYDAIRSNPRAMAAVAGTLAAAVGMMAAAAWQLAAGRSARRALAFAGGALLLSLAGLPPAPVIGLAALAGALLPESARR